MIEGGILRATPVHAAAMAAIHALCFPPRETWSEAVMALQLLQPGGFGLIDPEGGMLLARVMADEAEILTLAVRPRMQRQGRGRALLRQAAALAAGAGAGALFLEVGIGNAAALALYLNEGFAEVGRRPHYYVDGSDALVLRREIILSGAANG